MFLHDMGVVQKNITGRLFGSLNKCGVVCAKWAASDWKGCSHRAVALHNALLCLACLCARQHKDCPKVTKLDTTLTKTIANQPAAMRGFCECVELVACASNVMQRAAAKQLA